MVAKVALILLGLVALSAGGYIKTRVAPAQGPVRTYGQALPVRAEPLPTAAPETHEEPEEVEEEVETYKPAVRTPVDRSPIRVSYAKAPERDSYTSSSSYDSHSARMENEKLNDEQNRNAQYQFGTAIDDGINDMSQVRQESRDGLKVEGSYSYSDGFYKYTVKYVADENGYRVVENNKEQIGDGSGPIIDTVNGKADVHTSNQGVEMTYSVSAKELEDFSKDRLAESRRTKQQTPKNDDTY